MKIKKKYAISIVVILTIFTLTSVFASDKINSCNLFSDTIINFSYVDNCKTSTFQKVLEFKNDGKFDVILSAVFQVDNPKKFVSLALKKPEFIKGLTLNGKPIPKPFEKMNYKTVPAIPVELLKKGTNEFKAIWTKEIKKQDAPKKINLNDLDVQLIGQTHSDLDFQTGPILGWADENMFTVTCRVNIPAEVVLEVNDKKYISKKALLHSFKVQGLKPDTLYKYSFKTRLSPKDNFEKSIGPFTVRTLKGGENFSFAILGDSRTCPDDWAKVAAAVTAKKPQFAVFDGDMVTWGMRDYEWDEQFFYPAKDFFSTIPFYAVIGNHEANSPLFNKFFITPDKKNWQQKIGSVLIIGIDGTMDWETEGAQTKWLENILKNSNAKFIFLASHYPAYTSGGHGWLKDGRPAEKTIRVAQDVIMPILKKYNVTAMFSGHDHFYERSEPDNGVTMIVTGGAGAPLRDKAKNSEKQNPFSKLFAKKNHFCLLTVDGNACTMKVITPENEVIDTRSWKSRNNCKKKF